MRYIEVRYQVRYIYIGEISGEIYIGEIYIGEIYI